MLVYSLIRYTRIEQNKGAIMKTTLKVLGIIATANLLSNIGLQVIKSSGSVVGLGYAATGHVARAAKFALTPTPVMTTKMVEEAREGSTDQRHLSVA